MPPVTPRAIRDMSALPSSRFRIPGRVHTRRVAARKLSMMASALGCITRSLDRSASTIDRSRATPLLHVVVDDDVVVLAHGGDLLLVPRRAGAGSAPPCPCCGRRSRSSSTANDGGRTKMPTCSNPLVRTCARPARRSPAPDRAPSVSARSRLRRAGAVEVPEHVGALQQLARRDHRLEALTGDEIIVDAVGFACARRRAT